MPPHPLTAPSIPVLEITLLTPTSTSTSSTVLTQLQNVRTLLAEKVLPTHSRFYQSQDSEEICILGLWPNLKSHTDFLGDERLSDEILSPQKDELDWCWTGHVEVDQGVERVREMMRSVRVIEIGVWTVKISLKARFEERLWKWDDEGMEEKKGPLIVEGWGVDSEGNLGGGMTEFIRIRGLESLEQAEDLLDERLGEKDTADGKEDIWEKAQISRYVDLES